MAWDEGPRDVHVQSAITCLREAPRALVVRRGDRYRTSLALEHDGRVDDETLGAPDAKVWM